MDSEQPAHSIHEYHCPWCGLTSRDVQDSCPSCGASVDVRRLKDDSGWSELPPIKDMARLQFGQSFCQIEGSSVPVVDVSLHESDHVYFTHHVFLWKEPAVRMEAMPLLKGAWKRVFAGLPLVMTQAHGPGHIAFSQDEPGEVIALPLQRGQSVEVREGIFLVATGSVRYDWFVPNVYYRTAQQIQYPAGQLMDRFTAETDHGLILLHGGGNCFVRRLDPGQSILVKPTALLYKDPEVGMNLHIEHPGGYNRIWSRRFIWLRLTGPGRVAIQSRYPMWEDPPEPALGASPGSRIHDW